MSSNASRPRRELWSDISAEDTQGYHIPSSDDNSAIAAELDGDEEEPIAQNEPGGASASTALPEEAPCPEVQNALLPVSFSSAAAQRCNRMNNMVSVSSEIPASTTTPLANFGPARRTDAKLSRPSNGLWMLSHGNAPNNWNA
eukprot:CAMPEP_0206488328 /NCGR_PEP_ID=MMETSP0324_2-20121206/42334_1 /ASSEMBLY_ACC=CAM_ASM_000836 /TAXON_ID=2866 /ORGANISM="Crypthecodinium cohnii, Strain Seligo" /LENGTH=142 /DNA_ID=CAMNT_0053967305 /DNA_START=171 /DNA_END=600 /DNA_ORIENTATION=+